MVIISMPFKLAAYNAHKCNPVAVFGVKVGVYLKNKAGHFGFGGFNKACIGFPALWVGEISIKVSSNSCTQNY